MPLFSECRHGSGDGGNGGRRGWEDRVSAPAAQVCRSCMTQLLCVRLHSMLLLHAHAVGCLIGPLNAWLAVRSAALFDKQPVLKALIGPDFVKLPKPLEAVVNVFLSGTSLYVPAPLLPRSVAQAVRDAFRFPVRSLLQCTEFSGTELMAHALERTCLPHRNRDPCAALC